MLALLLLAVALGLDNLAAAIGFGAGATGRVSGGTWVRIAVVFGLFEAGMPVLGLLLGHRAGGRRRRGGLLAGGRGPDRVRRGGVGAGPAG